ncbi:Predicted oxidoreductase [Nonlabens sp. Hel1_33_55]|uniref:aldo/keto reductase n=1 Tax=Nonlabens sp. Hel1_33_55 TaxID=1336802 RepID=UPI000875C924|nr:aldo/keto reductase [Nonlabens sp. Hel1_33_55]SCY31076.1 Predicted oxidoreductase [Nonlabens sp. Hel1_33_55]
MALERYYTLGNTGLRVSRLALGTMTFGEEWGWGNDKKVAQQIFDYYLDHGGNFVDTADMYTEGTSEELLGEFMQQRGNREEIVLATKFTFNTSKNKHVNGGGNSRKNIRRTVEESLKRLKTDYIDLYIMHVWDRMTPAEEVMRTLNDLVAEGKILHYALSNVPSWYASKAQMIARYNNYEPVSALQLEYSLTQRNIEHEYIDLCQQTNTGIMAWSPLGGGLLSGKYKPGIDEQEDVEGRLKHIVDNGGEVSSKDNERNWNIVKTLHEVSEEINQPMASIALNWTANRPSVASVLVGATKMSQIEANMKALDFEIPTDLLQKLNDVSAPPVEYPYSFFQPKTQQRIYPDTKVGLKPDSYWKDLRIG